MILFECSVVIIIINRFTWFKYYLKMNRFTFVYAKAFLNRPKLTSVAPTPL